MEDQLTLISVPASEASPSPRSGQDSEPSPSARSTSIVAEFSSTTFQKSSRSKMLEKWMDESSKALIYLRQALRVSLRALPGLCSEIQMNDGYGLTQSESLAKLDARSRFLRTQQGCFMLEEGDCSTELLVSWPRSAILSGGILYQLASLVLLKDANESLLLPTLTTFDSCGDLKGKEYNGKSKHAMKLIQALKRGLLPTLNASADAKGSPKNRFCGSETERSNLRERLRTSMEDGIYIHPRFATWMMGFPADWLNIDTKSKDSVTPSSRNSPTKSCEKSAG